MADSTRRHGQLCRRSRTAFLGKLESQQNVQAVLLPLAYALSQVEPWAAQPLATLLL